MVVEVTIAIMDSAGPANLGRTLASLAAHTPERHEIALLVPCKGGDSPPAPPAGSSSAILHIPAPGGSAPAGLNRLLRATGSPYLLLLESGALVTPGWLTRLLAPLASPQIGLSGPSTNRAWNEQAVAPRGGGETWTSREIETFAAGQALRHGHRTVPLDTLHSLGDFCYLFKRAAAEAVGGFDEDYGAGPCWEIDFSTRAARAGYGAVWVPAAYVHRRPAPAGYDLAVRRQFIANKHLYQDRFCGLRLRNAKAGYEPHCRGEACEHFAPPELIRIQLATTPPPGDCHSDGDRKPDPATPGNADTHDAGRQGAAGDRQAPAIREAGPPAGGSSVGRPDLPLITCIMPTANRRAYIAQSLRYWARQDYANLELIVLDDGEDRVADLMPADPRVRYVALPRRMPIGAKRNLACEMAHGSIIAQWDDDDWYAAGRLSYQAAPLLNGVADISGLETACFFDLPGWAAWAVSPELHRRLFMHDVHGGTLLFWRTVWERLGRYPALSVAEDAIFLRGACQRGARLRKLPAAGNFVYLRHGSNAWRFPLGAYLDPAGWRRVDPARYIPAGDLPFYAALSPAAPPMAGPDLSGARPVLAAQAAISITAPTVAGGLNAAVPGPLPSVRPAAAPQAGRDGPLVSCIMPTANRRRYVRQALRYFLRQDYANCELIVLDDGEDPVADLIPADPRIRYTHLDRRLVLGAKRNLACEMARGEVIVHWDDDDWMAPRRLAYQVRLLEEAGADLCGARQQLYYDPAADRAWRYEYPVSARLWLAGNTLCYRKAYWARNPFPPIQVGEDTRFVWSQATPNAVTALDPTFYVGIIHSTNASPKNRRGAYWHSCPAAEAYRVLGDDLDFYLTSERGSN